MWICYFFFFSSLGSHPFAGSNKKVNLSRVVKGEHNDLGLRKCSRRLKALICTMMDVV
jgi:hypothetical protein